MAKAKIKRPWQQGPRTKVDLGAFWLALAKVLTERRGELSTLAVEKNGGPSYGVVQEHERGLFKSIRALVLHLRALGLSERVAFESAAQQADGELKLDWDTRQHLEHLDVLRVLQPKYREAIFLMTAETAKLAKLGAVPMPEQESIGLSEYLTTQAGSAGRKNRGR